MADIVIISLAAFFTAILTFYAGFGLGTLLMPVFAIFFPVEIAIALTGVVHFTNNVFKMVLIGKNADKDVLLRFGIPAFFASFAGAWMLLKLSGMPLLHSYEMGGRIYEITLLKLIIAFLLMLFSMMEILPKFQQFHFSKSSLIPGGILSGFFGGFAGIQGALRSAFLIKSGLTKEAYIATGVLIASLVDLSRLSVYASRFAESGLSENVLLLVSATTAAIAGTFAGNVFLSKVTLHFLQVLVAVMLILISVALGAGLI